ncbi:MAG: group I intron-associated PD-(D/E)XK endonuclease [Candidatus Cybelea sp.]
MKSKVFTPKVSGVSFIRDRKSIGELSELIVALELARVGYSVSMPLGENHRYDLIIDDGDKLSRVQVKTGRLRNGVILYNTYSSHCHRKGVACRPYTDQIDFFGIYCPDTSSVYLVPIADTAPSSGTLRVHAPKNGQGSRVRWAEPYLIAVARPAKLVVGVAAADGVTEPDLRVPS